MYEQIKSIKSVVDRKLDSLLAQADVAKKALGGLRDVGADVEVVGSALMAAEQEALGVRHRIAPAEQAADEAKARFEMAQATLFCALNAVLSAEKDPRTQATPAPVRFSEPEAFAIIDELTRVNVPRSVVAEQVMSAFPGAKAEYAARKIAFDQARQAKEAARRDWGNAVLKLEAALVGVRAELIKRGMKVVMRRRSSTKATADATNSKLEIVKPDASETPSAPPSARVA